MESNKTIISIEQQYCPAGNRTNAEDTGVDHIDQSHRDTLSL